MIVLAREWPSLTVFNKEMAMRKKLYAIIIIIIEVTPILI